MVVSPAYFAGTMQLGGLTQTASAFNSVQSALSFFINVYRAFAEWRAVIARLAGFEDAIASAQRDRRDNAGDQARRDRRARRSGSTALERRAAERHAAGRGRRHRIRAARPGAGRRAVGRRQVDAVPRDRRHLAVRQGHGLDAGERQGDDLAAAALSADRHARGRGQLSGDRRNVRRGAHPRAARGGRPAGAGRAAATRRRTGTGCCRSASSSASAIARAILQAPDYLLLDEATASLDEPAEAALYRLLHERLPAADHRVDRAPLDARGVPQAAADAHARGRALSGGRGGAQSGVNLSVPRRVSTRPDCLGQGGEISLRPAERTPFA